MKAETNSSGLGNEQVFTNVQTAKCGLFIAEALCKEMRDEGATKSLEGKLGYLPPTSLIFNLFWFGWGLREGNTKEIGPEEILLNKVNRIIL